MQRPEREAKQDQKAGSKETLHAISSSGPPKQVKLESKTRLSISQQVFRFFGGVLGRISVLGIVFQRRPVRGALL
jgi:hypothetical protein